MLRKSLLAAAVVLAVAGQLFAGGQNVQERLEVKLKTNGAFLEAAARIIAEDRSATPAAILKLAEESREEALTHLRSGQGNSSSPSRTSTIRPGRPCTRSYSPVTPATPG